MVDGTADSDMDVEEIPIPLSTDPAWHDVDPLYVDEGAPVVAIRYVQEHTEAMAYFRRIMDKGEYSQRALDLTTTMIRFNQADYTAWEWRWRCLIALKVDLTKEYVFTDEIMEENTKNYQLWNHRRKCALAMGLPAAARELQVAAEALSADAKHYHAWAHRQAIIQEFGGELWDKELAYCEQHIQEDVRNNSAWNQRAWITRHKLQQRQVQQQDPQAPAISTTPAEGSGAALAIASDLRQVLEQELEYISTQTARAPRNECVWHYLRGLFKLPGMPKHAMGMYDEVGVLCQEALLQAPSNPAAMDVFASYYMHQANLALHHMQQQMNQGVDVTTAQEAVESAVSTCMLLLDGLIVADPIRVMYWRHRQQGAQALRDAMQLTQGQGQG